MTHRIEFSSYAQKQFKKLPPQIQKRLQPQIDALAIESRPAGARKLAGKDNQYRIKVGDYRVVYEVRDAVLLIILLRIGHRREIYREP